MSRPGKGESKKAAEEQKLKYELHDEWQMTREFDAQGFYNAGDGAYANVGHVHPLLLAKLDEK